jgi:CSLREA domain-containing protein
MLRSSERHTTTRQTPLRVLSLAFLLVQAFHARTQFVSAAQAGPTYVVNSTVDLPDADPADGVCATSTGVCTLRAAIMQANFVAGPTTITVPSGVYVITRVGYDDAALVGDLDIQHDTTIQGAGSGATIVDGNGSVTHDRVFQVLSTVQNVTLSGMTIRNGESVSVSDGVIGGGGLYIEGSGAVHLSDVVVDSNTGQNGGGIYANFSSAGGSITMDNVIVRANTAIDGGVGAGGGVYAYLPSSLSAAVIRDSQVYGNTADGTGGGLFVDGNQTARWSIQRSQISSNKAASGGGIGNFVPLTLSDSRVYSNSVTFDGGAMEAFSPYSIWRTTLDANSAIRFGGAIFDLQTSGNPLYPEFGHVEQSTLTGNSAQYGGGIYHDGFITLGSLLTLTNSTLSSNGVYRPSGATGTADGGGIYVYGGQLGLFNATIAGNRVQLRVTGGYSGEGAGLFICVRQTDGTCSAAGGVFTAQNSLIANNARGNGITLDTPNDCFSFGTTGSLAFNLIRDMTNCFVTGPQVGNIVGQDPLLGPLQDNGGSTRTQALSPGSPAIDAGGITGCTSAGGGPITTDQRGFTRPYPPGGRCDIGAYEYVPPSFETRHLSDFDGDGKSDLTVFRPSSRQWYTLQSSSNYTTSSVVEWGLASDTPVPADYDGDGKTDPAMFRPSTGTWYILNSRTNYSTWSAYQWGIVSDVPIPGDYDGDGKADPAVYRPSTGQWFMLTSSSNYTAYIAVRWGISTDVPLQGDFDGDGKADPVVFRPSTGIWYVLQSSTNYTTSRALWWGLSTDVPVPGDYDGDGMTDPAVYRPSTGQWFFLYSSTTYTTFGGALWGTANDIPVPGDYDGNGRTDPAVYRPSTGQWFILNSRTSYATSIAVSWGISTDTPINKRP